MPLVRPVALVAVTASLALLAGCTPAPVVVADDLTIGTLQALTLLDPAAASDAGSVAILSQVHPHLVTIQPGGTEIVSDLAASAEFTSPTEYTVTLKSGLTFANGHELTASDVKFSIDRLRAIAEPEGPSLYLYNLVDVTADDLTVTFTLDAADDVLFPRILASAAGSIVDEEVFAADAITPDADVIAGNAFGGPYAVTEFAYESATTLVAVPTFKGFAGTATTKTITVQHYASDEELLAALEAGDVQLTMGDIAAELYGGTEIETGPGAQAENLVFNLATMPFGTATPEPDADKALAVREAIASVVDRGALSSIYEGESQPLLSFVPAGLEGSTDTFDLERDVDAAATALDTAGVDYPVALEIASVKDEYGPESNEVWTALAAQLNDSGLFTVSSVSTSWADLSTRRLDDTYPAYQFRWKPAIPAADLYLSDLFGSQTLLGNHYDYPELQSIVLALSTEPDQMTREGLIKDAQVALATDIPVLPLLQSTQNVATDGTVSGVILDGSQVLRLAALSRPAASQD